MSFQIGAVRFDRGRYNSYIVYFYDVSGLARKADVKIAGVKVGWVDHVELVNNGDQVKATVLVLKEFVLHTDAYGLVRQEGLLGSKYLEIIPGDPLAPVLKPGGVLTKPSRDPVSIDELLHEFKHIAHNVAEVTDTFKEVLGGPDGIRRLNDSLQNFSTAADRVAHFADDMHHLIQRNGNNVDSILNDFRDVASEIRAQVPGIAQDIRQLAERIQGTVLPAIEQSVTRVSNAVDRDFNRFATKFENAARPLEQVVCKINDGRGILGKLVNDDEAYNDLRVAVTGLKNYFAKIDKLTVVFDTHFESMQGLGNKVCFEDAKGYFNIRIHPLEDYFYLVGYVGVMSGKITRYQKFRRWYDGECKEIIPAELPLAPRDRLKYSRQKDVSIRQEDAGLWNVQFGKIYGPFAFRFGMFESTFGVGMDLDIPFPSDKFRWVTTLEMFDMRGRNRFGDDRPHLKWLNKVFFTQNIYGVFGADDFVSRHTKNGFVGAGIRFADDDIKYLLSRVSINT